MNVHSHTPITELRSGALMRVEEGAGHAIAVFDGLLWITQSGDSRDVFLRPGESFSFDGSGRVVMQALSNARLAVCPVDDGQDRSGRARTSTMVSAAVAIASGLFLMFGGATLDEPAMVASATPADAAIAR
ncbi:DUF2917 domain-containing protein [Piscinibacter sp. XHJ-5]|uniref:DUF2917 domain-containing protein n=1 Tax=Piscinibacter sp. XHJ-5 TaxID=3037797 RepID=UPI002452D89D|nr:DUF2917 domain-containing protein [Piscinibacter sp. XHJ-5]